MSIANTAVKESYLRYRQEIDEAVQRVLEGGWYILGKSVSDFEREFSNWCGAAHCVGVGNGTDAIAIALRALEIGPGDAVFTVSHTAVATVAAIESGGAEAVLVDIEPGYFTIDPIKLEDTILAHQRAGKTKLRAVIAVHLYGNLFDIPAIKAICDRYDLQLIEDCAQAHGATFGGEPITSFGVVSTFSFYPTKNLGAFGDGGAIVTNDPDIAARMAAIRQYGWYKHYLSDVVGINSRLDELHAAILSVKLRYLSDEVAARRAVAKRYDEGLRGIVATPPVRADGEHAYHLYVIRSERRDNLAADLKAAGIGTGIHYPVPIHLQKAYAGRITCSPGGMWETERAAKEVLSLPMHPFLTPEEVDTVIAAVKSSMQSAS